MSPMAANLGKAFSLPNLQVGVFFVGQRHGCGFGHLLVVLIQQLLVDLNLWGRKSGCCDKLKLGIANQLSGQPQEGLLKVIIGLGRNVVILEVLLAMECNRLRLDFTLLDINLVATEDDGDIFANTDKVT